MLEYTHLAWQETITWLRLAKKRMAVLPCQIERPNEHVGKMRSEQLRRELLV